MGFEDDLNFNDDFETETTDLDSNDASEQPKKMSRKDFRKAKKKTAEKAAEAKPKKSLFNRRSSKPDDNDSDDGLGDDMFASSSVGGNDNFDAGSPIKTEHSEFSYLFEPLREGEDEDDVYPDSSIYSDSDAAKNMLGGLSYDGSDDGSAEGFHQYFDNPTETRPPSQFSFHNHSDDFSLPSGINTPIGTSTSDLPVTPPASAPAPAVSDDDKPDSYLPGLRADSVFINKDTREPTPTAPMSAPAPEPEPEPPVQASPEPPEPKNKADNYGAGENYAKVDEAPPAESVTQEFLPYGSMYPSYPMNPMNNMNPVVNYPIVIPNGGQTQGAPYQTIPIPYPMPMPMPMYNQYPQYPPQPQYPAYPPQPQYVVIQPQPQPQVQPQPQPQPPQPQRPQYDDRPRYTAKQSRREAYDDYDDERYERDIRRTRSDRDDRYDREERYDRDDYDDRRRTARGTGRRRSDSRYDDRDDRYYNDGYDDRRDYRYDNDGRYNERAAARYYDERRGRYERRSNRYYDRIDARSYNDGHRAERKTYPKPPYEPPYEQQLPEPEPTPVPTPEPIKAAPVPEPIKTENPAPQVDPTPLIENKPLNPPPVPKVNDNLLGGFDAAFDSPMDGFGFDLGSFGMNAFGSETFDPNAPYSSDNGGFNGFDSGGFGGFDEFSGGSFNRH